MKKVFVAVRSVYGNDLIYPQCEVSQIFADISGKKTLTVEILDLIKRIGFEVEFKIYERMD